MVSPAATCTACDNTPSPYMESHGKQCDTWGWFTTDESGYCTNTTNHNYVNRYCRQACFDAGKPYPGDACCPSSPSPCGGRSTSAQVTSMVAPAATCTACDNTPSPYMESHGKQCDTWGWFTTDESGYCTNTTNNNYVNRYCRQACFDAG